MNRQQLSIFVIAIVTIVIAIWLVSREPHNHNGEQGHGHGEHDSHAEEFARGPHNGRLLQKEAFALEMTIFESGVPPEFHIYPYVDNKPVDPDSVKLNIKLHRTGDKTDDIGFVPQQDFLKGDKVIYEPHSFEVEATAVYNGVSYTWRYDNFEGRTQIAADMAQAMGIKTGVVGPVMLVETLTLAGQVHTNPNKLARVRPRFAGVVTSIKAELGQQVKAGDVLASVQSNESLQTYLVKAPIDGEIVQRDLQIGEATGEQPLFVIADLSEVWIELDVFSRDLDKVKPGQSVTIETLDVTQQLIGQIKWISPLTAHASQSVRARVPLPNTDNTLRPGQFIRGQVVIAEHQVELAVRQSAIQTFRDFQVVYGRFGDTYEVRMLELGRRNSEWVEVLGGIDAGTEYVTEHSYLIKADIEKSGASHDH